MSNLPFVDRSGVNWSKCASGELCRKDRRKRAAEDPERLSHACRRPAWRRIVRYQPDGRFRPDLSDARVAGPRTAIVSRAKYGPGAKPVSRSRELLRADERVRWPGPRVDSG